MIYEFDGYIPVVHESSFVHPLAVVTGNVIIGRNVYIGPGAALRGDWAIRGSYVHYDSPWQKRPDFYRYDELTVDLRYRDTLFFSVAWSPNTSRYGSAYGVA